MKLPDFTLDSALNELRRNMGAELRDFTLAPIGNFITPEEIEKLATEGVEIPIEDVQVLNDGTHVYKGRRVVVYIRDVNEYGDRYSLPRFHLAMCDTLARMVEQGRYRKRYVVATRDDGLFKIHIIRDSRTDKRDERLDVCQNCLQEIHYKGFSPRLPVESKRARVRQFSLQTFFEEYGRSCVWATPSFDADNAPINVYSAHFYKIARAIKEQRGYRCEELGCKIDLSALEDRKFLHAHHLNAAKSDNHPSNIRLLCIRCHANAFQHSHLRQSPDFKRFCSKFPLPSERRNQN
jgi:hypothetical protein